MGRPDWWWIGRDFPTIFRKSRTNRWELTGPSCRAPFAADVILLPEGITDSFSIWLCALAVGQSTHVQAPNEGKLGAYERVNALRVTQLHIRTSALKMPPVGPEPGTSTHVSQPLTQHAKWADAKRPPIFTDSKENGGPARRARGKCENENANENENEQLSHFHFHFIFKSPTFSLSFSHFPRARRGGPRFR